MSVIVFDTLWGFGSDPTSFGRPERNSSQRQPRGDSAIHFAKQYNPWHNNRQNEKPDW